MSAPTTVTIATHTLTEVAISSMLDTLENKALDAELALEFTAWKKDGTPSQQAEYRALEARYAGIVSEHNTLMASR